MSCTISFVDSLILTIILFILYTGTQRKCVFKIRHSVFFCDTLVVVWPGRRCSPSNPTCFILKESQSYKVVVPKPTRNRNPLVNLPILLNESISHVVPWLVEKYCKFHLSLPADQKATMYNPYNNTNPSVATIIPRTPYRYGRCKGIKVMSSPKLLGNLLEGLAILKIILDSTLLIAAINRSSEVDNLWILRPNAMTIRIKSKRIPAMDSTTNPGLVSHNNAVPVSSESCRMACVRLIATWLSFLICWDALRRSTLTSQMLESLLDKWCV